MPPRTARRRDLPVIERACDGANGDGAFAADRPQDRQQAAGVVPPFNGARSLIKKPRLNGSSLGLCEGGIMQRSARVQ